MSKTIFKLDTRLSFGKYRGCTVQEIINDKDPNYLYWCMNNIEWFELDDEAYEMLDKIVNPDYLTDYSWHEAFDLLA